jgi:hypothetical protein
MRNVILAVLLVTVPGCSACGMSSRNNELTGQIKRVTRETPILCDDYDEIDVSLGVLRNGNGSVSKEDVNMTVNDHDVPLLKRAAETGAIVKLTYDQRRVTFCTPKAQVTAVVLEDGSGSGTAAEVGSGR